MVYSGVRLVNFLSAVFSLLQTCLLDYSANLSSKSTFPSLTRWEHKLMAMSLASSLIRSYIVEVFHLSVGDGILSTQFQWVC
jgi:hypothetical protein